MTSQLMTLRQMPVPLDLDLKGHMMGYREGVIIFYRATTFFLTYWSLVTERVFNEPCRDLHNYTDLSNSHCVHERPF